jgi:hypothetical protein
MWGCPSLAPTPSQLWTGAEAFLITSLHRRVLRPATICAWAAAPWTSKLHP